MPSATLRFSGETTFETTPSTTPNVVPESASPMVTPAVRPKRIGVDARAIVMSPIA